MKYLVLFAVLVVIYLLWRAQQRRQRTPGARADTAPRADPALPQDMVQCPVCALHLPRNEAVADPQGRLFCSPEHRASARR